jgi:hypothetical protein
MKETKELIDVLSLDVSADARGGIKAFATRYWLSFFIVVLISGLLTAGIAHFWPEDAHVPVEPSMSYFLEALLWIFGVGAAAAIAYEGVFPGPVRKPFLILAGLLLSLGSACLFWKASTLSLGRELPVELDILRGRCGFFIMLTAPISTAWMFAVLRMGATTRSWWPGLWGGASMACVGAFFMHLVCPHDNPLHLMMWHFVPVMTLMSAGAFAGRWVLKW